MLYIICFYFNKNNNESIDISINFITFANVKTIKINLNNNVMTDFGYENETSEIETPQDNKENPVGTEEKENLNGDGKQFDKDGNVITNINDPDNKDKNEGDKDKDDKDTSIELNAGEVIEINDKSYTVAENGDLVDKDGKVFKEAKDVQEYLKSLESDDKDDDNVPSTGEINIKNLQKALGYEIVDDNDKDIEYENNIEGVKTYIEDVIEQKSAEIQEATINTLFDKFPFAQQMINYYIANGNSLEGWGVTKDRSGITIDENNEKQQEDIIKTAWVEQKRTGDVESYIAYLKSAGILLSTAKSELEGLKAADKAKQDELAKKAKAAHDAQEAEMNEFWKGVETAIKGRKIGGYQIPEQIKITRDGKSYMVTPDDFYKYLSVTDKNGETAYAKDCKAVSPEQELNDSLLKAYIMFTGGDYSSLVDMAIKDKEVRTLRFKAKETKQPTRRYSTPKNNNNNNNSMDLGY